MSSSIAILLVEDNLGDINLTSKMLKAIHLPYELFIARDGVEALAYLRQEGDYNGAKRPNLILLDLNLPKKGGRAVLEEIKGNSLLKQIPVVIMTTSDAPQDISASREFEAHGYITKPSGLEEFSATVKRIEALWLQICGKT